MNVERKSLFDIINKESSELGDILRENDITEAEDIQSLCYEALLELFPGGGRKIIQRSKVWKITQASVNDGKWSVSSKSSSPSSRASVSSPSHSDDMGILIASIDCSPTIKTKTSLPFTVSSPEPPKLTLSSSPDGPQNLKKPHPLKTPEYILYSDPAVRDAVLEGSLNKSLRERLIRGTMNNMVTASSSPPFNRFPKPNEMEEMAKSLIIAYPCLQDDETCHGVVFKALKRRLSNTKPVVKPQGPAPKKRKYIGDIVKDCEKIKEVKKEDTDVGCDDGSDDYSDDYSDDHKTSDDPIDGKEIMYRHHMGLLKELEKKKPNADVVNSYLNKEFTARRDWLQDVSPGERVKQLLQTYPCFKDHVEIIEEARRVLMIEPTGDLNKFKNICLERLAEEVETIIYYGIHSKGICAPKSHKPNSKIMHVLQNLHTVFGAKKPNKKPMDLVHELKDHEDPENWCSRRSGNVTGLLLEKNKCYLIVGKDIMCEMEMAKFNEAALALLACFYLLDFDYPRMQEIGLNLLQHYIFKDTNVPQDIANPFKSTLTNYQRFKDGMQ